MLICSFCGSGLLTANPRFVPAVSLPPRKSLCLARIKDRAMNGTSDAHELKIEIDYEKLAQALRPEGVSTASWTSPEFLMCATALAVLPRSGLAADDCRDVLALRLTNEIQETYKSDSKYAPTLNL